ncbi:RNase adapter RapZ [Curtobacterium sp. MCBD17_034]|uniref:RNase adapter RapZ n=1 Tax=unclassified Curtobacterium TaxID=257496 RepID=UPI000DA80B95|nr:MULTISPECIES: RNase adapter RapZ [unclassified Curtobacterium]PZE77144.1 RNase adapter RapZ [Curtobacterium sp. MCBD17_019]PZF59176.1 RNase adapter RapZ [Curtobacterium sp. MCBD17_034]PZF65172.1 RNase adapter RapZ [Curtobacterium sp. MCBD17_013]PZM34282.1 RNase adapter RapZ [Curtobacterium sp. MCBD17_031]WIB62268.1 RNase adapter RapZ [Curtobacterium sp. MCBD17_040]
MTDLSSPSHDVLIVTGMSGAGRSTVGKALEDLGWYVVDNLPTQMLGPLTDLAERAGESLPKIATVVDVRGGRFFTDPEGAVRRLRDSTTARVRVLFLEATDAVLVRRFEQVRRPHPLQGEDTLLDGIGRERSRLLGLREASDVVIDTSDLNIHQLAARVAEQFAEDRFVGVQVTLMSFGFKYGLPADADMVADVRFLPNPYWVPELREHTGLDADVADYVLGQDGARPFIDRYAAAVEPVLAGYQRENKRHATIAIGCTGGKHRSVAIVAELASLIRGMPNVAVRVKNRDLGRE